MLSPLDPPKSKIRLHAKKTANADDEEGGGGV